MGAHRGAEHRRHRHAGRRLRGHHAGPQSQYFSARPHRGYFEKREPWHLICLNLTRAGFGQSAFLNRRRSGHRNHHAGRAEALDKDEKTDAVVMVGEIGGAMEEDAAEYAKGMKKPVVAFIAGRAHSAGKKIGNAGAIVTGNRGTYASKRNALEAPAS